MRLISERSSAGRSCWSILATGLLLCLLLVACRALILKISPHGISVATARMLLSASSGDIALAGLFTAAFLVLAAIAGPRRWTRRAIQAVFYLGTIVIAVSGIINVQVVELLGEPFSLPWLYYSDFLRTGDSLSGVAQAVSPTAV